MASVEKHIVKISSAIEAGDAARSTVVASWHRCAHAYGLDPSNLRQSPHVVSDAEFRIACERGESLLRSSTPTLDRLQRMLDGTGICILIAGADGVPIDWRGNRSDSADLQRWGLWPGVDWSEASEGTNGIGTCIVEERPLTVHCDQHFFRRDIDITCTVAPIFDHGGQLSGALNVTLYNGTPPGALTGMLQAVVSDAARQIELDHFHHAFHDARILSVPGAIRSGAQLLAIDSDDMIVGATRGARLSLGLTDRLMHQGTSVGDLLHSGEDSLAEAERGVIRRTLARHRGNVSAAAKALDISRATMKRKLKLHRLKKHE